MKAVTYPCHSDRGTTLTEDNMSIILPNQTLEVTVATWWNAQAGLNILHYIVESTAGGDLTAQALATNLFNRFKPFFEGWLPLTAYFEGVKVQVIQPIRLNASVSIGIPVVGMNTSGIMSPQTAGLISTRATLAGPKYRGRIYVPFPARDRFSESNGLVTVAGETSLAAYSALVGPQIDTDPFGLTPRAVLRLLTSADGAAGNRMVEEMMPRKRAATQRRRSLFGQTNPPII